MRLVPVISPTTSNFIGVECYCHLLASGKTYQESDTNRAEPLAMASVRYMAKVMESEAARLTRYRRGPG